MVRKQLCATSEWFKLQKILWLIVASFALIGAVVTVGTLILRMIDQSDHQLFVWLTSRFGFLLNLDRDLEEFLRNFFVALLFFSGPFVFVVCKQRKALISGLASGYWANYLSYFTQSDLKLFLVPPRYYISVNADSAVYQTKRMIEEAYGVELREELIPEISGSKKTAFVPYRGGNRLPVAIDMCRNLVVLGDIIDKELSGLAGGLLCDAETKFSFISKQYFRTLKKEWIEPGDYASGITIVDGIKDPALSMALNPPSTLSKPG